MNRIEEVKKITHPDCYYHHFGKSCPEDIKDRLFYNCDKCEEEARQICQLFPQPLPDEGLREEAYSIVGNFWCELNEDMEELKKNGWTDEEWCSILALTKMKFSKEILTLFQSWHEQKCKECEYDPQAEMFGWLIDHGWTPPGELQQRIEQERERIESWLYEWLGLESPILLNHLHNNPYWQALKEKKL